MDPRFRGGDGVVDSPQGASWYDGVVLPRGLAGHPAGRIQGIAGARFATPRPKIAPLGRG
ncbi:hypothetical protein HNQ60_004187 [Povalibacter uvarum]|uniref:Uncharacterized protein n=1 Tax=Povalibacter uvarum TaxID=732238 RepID=A0A841HQ20_9GAMM|nr:hypothetical protein [Povalibacter uvarum]